MREVLVEQASILREEIKNAGLDHLLQMQQELLTHRAQVACRRNQLNQEIGQLSRVYEEVDQEFRCADALLDRVMDALRDRIEADFGGEHFGE